MMMKSYTEIKSFLVESLLESFSQAEGDEMEAMVTHWLQSQDQEIPFLTQSMREHCIALLQLPRPRLSRTARVRESNEKYQVQFPIDWEEIPFPPVKDPKFKFIDLFAGIGGFRIAMQELGGKCVFSSEWDPYSKATYEANFGEVPYGDIRKINEQNIPDHDILCAGFPCQPFSKAGVSARKALGRKHGFSCQIQGTLFFDIVRIAKAKQPKVLLLENVKHLLRHDGGRTFDAIQHTIENDLEYSFSPKILDSSTLVPQRRERCYIVCVRPDLKAKFVFPSLVGTPIPLSKILIKNPGDKYTISTRLWEGHQNRTKRNLARGVGFTAFLAKPDKPANTLVARYYKDGKECLIPQLDGKNPRKLTPRECAKLQGFPNKFRPSKSDNQAYRQFGNSVAVPVVTAIAKKLLKDLDIVKRFCF